MNTPTLAQMFALTLSISLTVSCLAAEPEISKDPLLKTLEARLTQLHALQEKRLAAGDMPAAKMYQTNVLLNRAQYLAKEKTKTDFLNTSQKLHSEALASLDARIKLGSPPSDEEFETIFEFALADLALK